ncbi:MAG: Hsp33 family molecular chaperone HslO [Spongiibacteraceae bacterium]|nr:Hsp33 family molecular chaperone HslO [Spongiibacteraceae bacterium]
MTDQLQRFIFENTDIRGELARLDQSYLDAIATHHYPEPVARLLGEFLTAVALLSATLKFEGMVSLQARSKGQIPLIMAEASSDQTLRAIAREADQASSDDFKTLLADGQLAISIIPSKGKRYQGIVALDGHNLAECLQDYFRQSEQLATRLWLYSDSQRATGMLLQALPSSEQTDSQNSQKDWEHICHLTDTLTEEEILSLEFEKLLYRLYHQEQVRLFEATPLSYQCSCSRQRTLEVLKALGQEEAEKIVHEHGSIEVDCEFCHQHYHFTNKDIQSLFLPRIH